MTLHEVNRSDALAAATMYGVGKPFGLSLGDRLCLALGQRLGAEVVTADVVWLGVAEALGLRVNVIR